MQLLAPPAKLMNNQPLPACAPRDTRRPPPASTDPPCTQSETSHLRPRP